MRPRDLRAAARRGAHRRERTRTFDVVHAHFGPYGLYALEQREAGALEGPLVTSFHGHDVHRVPRRRGRDVYMPLFAAGQRFTANTRFTADAIVRLGCPNERLEILPMGLVLPEVPALPRPSVHPRRILTIARHVEKKGLEYGIRAIAALAGRHPLGVPVVSTLHTGIRILAVRLGRHGPNRPIAGLAGCAVARPGDTGWTQIGSRPRAGRRLDASRQSTLHVPSERGLGCGEPCGPCFERRRPEVPP